MYLVEVSTPNCDLFPSLLFETKEGKFFVFLFRKNFVSTLRSEVRRRFWRQIFSRSLMEKPFADLEEFQLNH